MRNSLDHYVVGPTKRPKQYGVMRTDFIKEMGRLPFILLQWISTSSLAPGRGCGRAARAPLPGRPEPQITGGPGAADAAGARRSGKNFLPLPSSPPLSQDSLFLPEGSPFPKGLAGTLGQGLWAEATKGLLSCLLTTL